MLLCTCCICELCVRLCSNCSTYASSLPQVLMYSVPIPPSYGELVMHKRSALCMVAMYMVTLSLGNVCMFINYLNLQAQICKPSLSTGNVWYRKATSTGLDVAQSSCKNRVLMHRFLFLHKSCKPWNKIEAATLLANDIADF